MASMRTPTRATIALLAFASTARADRGDPLPGLSAADQARFQSGRAQFLEVETVADGLGPLFNEASCGTCHTSAGGFVGGNTTRVETRFGELTASGFDPLASLGGSLMQDHAIGSVSADCNFVPEVVPAQANVVALRRTTPLFGLGLVDAVPESSFFALAAQERQTSPATAGTVALVTDPDTHRANAAG